MKKYLIALVLGLVLLLALATTVAMADNGPHGGFTASTDACAGCHRVHTAQYGSNSLLIMDPEALCLSCHDGTGASTNVEDGVYTNAAGLGTEGVNGGSLFAGGFENAVMATNWSGKYAYDAAYFPGSRPTTSEHDMDVSGTVWGSGANNTPNGTMTLECTSCHNPHGGGGWNVVPGAGNDTMVPTYRLLRWQPSGSGGFTAPSTTVNWSGGAFPANDNGESGWTVPDKYTSATTIKTEWYTIGTQVINGTGPFTDGDYNNGNGSGTYQPWNGTATQSYIDAAVNVPFFCAQCHDRYFNNSRMRNSTDASLYCGAPYGDMVSNNVALTVYADADGLAPYIHPDPAKATRCEPVVSSTTGLLASWGDNGDSGDTVYTYRHASGDVRVSSDGTNAAGTLSSATSLSRACSACHVSHGTAAAADAVLTDSISAAAATLSNDSALLRMDGRTICLRCHASSVGFTTTASASPVTYASKDVSAGPAMGGTEFIITGTGFSTSTNPGVTGVRYIYTNGAAVSTTTTMSMKATALDGDVTKDWGSCFASSTTTIVCRTNQGYGAASMYIVTTGTVLTPAGSFTFTTPPAPTITAPLGTVSGPIAGGTTVVITGTNFANSWAATDYKVTGVLFGAKSYSMTTSALTAGKCRQDSTTQLTCVTTTALAGAVDVRVTTSGGSYVVSTGAYTFVP